MIRVFALLSALSATHAVSADSDWDEDITDTSTVNGGELVFLAVPPAKRAHHHVNHLTITADSLDSGWVRLDQCHYDIDPVPDAQIVYTADRIRALRLVSTQGIGKAWIEGHSVQLQNIDHGASVCIAGETRALVQEAAGYALRNGPFMRCFLVGYYPMRVSLIVDHPPGLALEALSPESQPGVKTVQHPGHVELDIWFEGILRTQLIFRDEDSL